MARPLTVATLNLPYQPIDPSRGYEAIVAQTIDYLRHHIEAVLPEEPDLILLPEVCDQPAGFARIVDTPAKVREFLDVRSNRVTEALGDLARQHRSYLAFGTLIQADDGTTRNALVVLDRDGREAGRYHKNYIVPIERDHYGTLHGREAGLISCDFGTLGCLICFDLNFDELRHRYMQLRPDLLLFSSMFQGNLMVPYWAFACRCHLVTSISNGQPSGIYRPTGDCLARSTRHTPWAAARINLDCVMLHLNGHEGKLAAIRKRFGRGVSLHDPGDLGVVLLTAEAEGLHVEALIAEYELTPYDVYLDNVLADRNQPGHME